MSSWCRKCGIMKKSGRSSCCGRGGSWFSKCGGAHNPNFEHTWFEGIRACKYFAAQAKPRGIAQPSQETQEEISTITNTVGIGSKSGTADSEGNAQFTICSLVVIIVQLLP